MKWLSHLGLLVALILCSCTKEPTKEPITSIVGTYKLGFNAASDGWKLSLYEDGKGSLTHMSSWEYYGNKYVSNFTNCKSFTYVVNGDKIEFSNCKIALTYSENNSTFGYLNESPQITLKDGTIKWGYTQDLKKHNTAIDIQADVIINGKNAPNSAWNHPTAYLCDENGNVFWD